MLLVLKNFLLVKIRNVFVKKKKMFLYEGFVCCYMIFIFFVIICDFIVWFFLKYCFSVVSDSILIRDNVNYIYFDYLVFNFYGNFIYF